MTKTSKTINEIRQELELISDEKDNLFLFYQQDSRKGVAKLVERRIKVILNDKKQIAAHQQRLSIERSLYATNRIQTVAGIDEVGRGPLAGPLVVAAVILPHDCDTLVGVSDSKQLSHAKRVEYDRLIREVALAIQVVVFDASQIDQLNIYEATRQAMRDAAHQLSIQPDYLLLDAMTIDSDLPQESIIKGDQRSLSIAAASIVAKVYRDDIMCEYAKIFPEFEFERNMGYGTAGHLKALETYGYTPIHRQSFAPVAQTRHAYQS